MWTGRAELLTSPIIPVTSPGIEPTVDFCESAVLEPTVDFCESAVFDPFIQSARSCCIYSTMVKDRALTHVLHIYHTHT
jgi:hypothetical protein